MELDGARTLKDFPHTAYRGSTWTFISQLANLPQKPLCPVKSKLFYTSSWMLYLHGNMPQYISESHQVTLIYLYDLHVIILSFQVLSFKRETPPPTHLWGHVPQIGALLPEVVKHLGLCGQLALGLWRPSSNSWQSALLPEAASFEFLLLQATIPQLPCLPCHCGLQPLSQEPK